MSGRGESICDTALLASLKSAFALRSVRRLDICRSIRVGFPSPFVITEFVGLVSHAIELLIPNTAQCSRYGDFGHVKAVRTREIDIVCLGCSKSRPTGSCTATHLHCMNCGKSHEATSKLSSRWHQERSVCCYSTEHTASLRAACTAVCAAAGMPTVPSVRADITPYAA